MTQVPLTTVPATEPAKPGFASSEFWQGLLVVAAGCFLIVYGAVSDKQALVETGAILAGAQGIGYAAVRGVVKVKTA